MKVSNMIIKQVPVSNPHPRLSILMPAVRSRDWAALYQKLLRQRGKFREDVEVIVNLDNGFDYSMKPLDEYVDRDGNKTSGAKRQELFDIASGVYVAYVDDDDDVSKDYMLSLMEVILSEKFPDVITFDMKYGKRIVKFRMDGDNDINNGVLTPNHLCAWKREISEKNPWDKRIGYGDVDLKHRPLVLSGLVKKCINIDAVLYRYSYSAKTTMNQNDASVARSAELFNGTIPYVVNFTKGNERFVYTRSMQGMYVHKVT